jgi:hypothetical protein
MLLLTDYLMNLWIDQGFQQEVEAQGWTGRRGLKHRSGEVISILANAHRPKTHVPATEN